MSLVATARPESLDAPEITMSGGFVAHDLAALVGLLNRQLR